METGVYVSRTDTDEWEPDEEVGGSFSSVPTEAAANPCYI